MKDAVVHVVSSVQDERWDEELLHACTSIARVRPESIVIFFEDAAHLLDFALESSSSSSDSGSSSGSEAETVAYHELESNLNEKQAFFLLQYALPLLGMFREYCESRELTYSTINLAPWGTLALFWCERCMILEFSGVLHSFLHLVCWCEASNTMLRSIRTTLDLLLEQLHDTISLDAPEQSIAFAALKDLVKDAPQAVFAALEPKLAHDEQFVAIILGQLVVQTTFPAATLTSNSLWKNILDRMLECDDVATLSTYLWFVSMFISIAPMFISQDSEKLLHIVHRAVWLCTDSGKVTQLQQSSLLPPSKSSYPENPFFKMFGKSQARFEPSKFPPVPPVPQHESDEFYRIPEALSVLETFTETPSPGNRFRIRQIDIWFNQALDDSFPDGIRTLRLTVQDSDTGVLSVLNTHGSSPTEDSTFKKTISLEPGEYFTKFDVSFAEENGQHIKYVNALRFSTNVRRYPWLGTPSNLPHLDAIISSPYDPPELVSSSSFELSSGSDDSTVLDGDEIIGLFGAFQDGILLEMGGVFATPMMPSPNIHVEHILLYTSYLFQSLYVLQPWTCLKFLHDPASTSEAYTRVLQSLCLEIGVHPGILPNSLQWTTDTFFGAMAWLCEGPSLRRSSSPSLASDLLQTFSTQTKLRELEALQSLKLDAAQLEQMNTKDYQRELKVEKEISKVLHQRLQQQRIDIEARDTEQTKWYQQVQKKLDKYAQEQKHLTEENVELHYKIEALQANLKQVESAMHLATAKCVQLQGEADHEKSRVVELTAVAEKCKAMQDQLAIWSEYHEKEITRLTTGHAAERDRLMSSYEEMLKEARARVNVQSMSSSGHDTDSDDRSRILELEKLLKQKEQGMQALRTMLERQQNVSDEMHKSLNRKYDNIKAINLALQKHVLNTSKPTISSSSS